MTLIPVSEALGRLFALVPAPRVESVPLTQALGRVLLRAVAAGRDQPPFRASAMDGYAVPEADPQPGATYQVIGQSAAGQRWNGHLQHGQAVRILTGAPVPDGAHGVVIQEDVLAKGDGITLLPGLGPGSNIRPAGGDFRQGATMAAPLRLRPADIALAAAMGRQTLYVARRPAVAIIATGDELVAPGVPPGPDQISASNSYGLHALLTAVGALPRLLPIARDNLDALALAFDLGQDADLVLTIGGASVGDHDLVAQAAKAAGFDMAFHRVAIRPGKPLMAGRNGAQMLLGLPGNPVSAMVCGHVFLAPVIAAMQGLPAAPAPRERLPLAVALPANGNREHYLRATIGPEGVSPLPRQDSALLSVLAQADGLIVQPAGDTGAGVGTLVDVIRL